MITVTSKGDFSKTTKFFERMKQEKYLDILDKYGKQGVAALSEATPRKTGKTADSWTYKIIKTSRSATITWHNSSETSTGIPIVLLLQYGHGTRNGGYVKGIDFINPAMKDIFKKIADDAWKEVTKN